MKLNLVWGALFGLALAANTTYALGQPQQVPKAMPAHSKMPPVPGKSLPGAQAWQPKDNVEAELGAPAPAASETPTGPATLEP